ncbi:hypothetical protein OG455_33820 [Kitasatospora sp. NBC_01287]|uniref:hypothetical protein n=1 Tax=Kitasatospora sp. NBC_01287 TaxID=2903573 RepID=UPI0022503564|nr:hypothetical protein [Kitasatospora sp. NBC_01287]MCX4750432.1 hypothetical protein [Kitasatospora sp. NBC_01287]
MNSQGTVRSPARSPERPAPDGPAAAARELGVNALISSVFLIGGLLGLLGLVLGIAALVGSRRTGAGRRESATAVVASVIAIAVSALVAVLALRAAHQAQDWGWFGHVHQQRGRLVRLLLRTAWQVPFESGR